MKFRASKANYYSDADTSVGVMIQRKETLLIKAGSYLTGKFCTKPSTSENREVYANGIIACKFPDGLSAPIEFKTKFEYPNDHCTQLFPTDLYHAMPHNSRIEQLLTNFTITIRQTLATAIVSLLANFIGFKVTAIASKISKQTKMLEEKSKDSTNDGTRQRDLVCSTAFNPKSQQRNVGIANDGIHQLELRRKTNCEEVLSIENFRYLLQHVIALIQNKDVWLLLLSFRYEPFIEEQSKAAASFCSSDKRKKRVDFKSDSQRLIKQQSEDMSAQSGSINSFSNNSLPTIRVVHELTSDPQDKRPNNDFSRKCAVDDIIQTKRESSHKGSKVKKRKRGKHRHTTTEENHSILQGTPKMIAQPEKIVDGSNTAETHLSKSKLELAMKKIHKLGDVDDELNTARDSINSKFTNNRNAYLTSKLSQGGAQLDIKKNSRLKWQSWNAFRHDSQNPTSSLPSTTRQVNCKQVAAVCSLNCNVEGCSGLHREIGYKMEHGCDKINNDQHYRPTESVNTFASNLTAEHQSTGENPFQQLLNNPSIENLHGNFPEEQNTAAQLSPSLSIKILCSETFLDYWGEIVAAIVSGEWISSTSGGNSFQCVEKTINRRKISVVDTPLLNGSGIDIEASHDCCFLVISASHLQSSEEAKETVLKLAELVAFGRYAKCYIFFCLDIDLSSTMAKHMVKIQFAAAASSIHVICKTSTFSSLAATMAHTILSLPNLYRGDDHLDSLTIDRISFLTTLLPVASIGGSIKCLTMARSLLPNGSPYFEIILKNQRLRQHIFVSLLCHETTDALNPLVLVQLSYALRYGRRM